MSSGPSLEINSYLLHTDIRYNSKYSMVVNFDLKFTLFIKYYYTEILRLKSLQI